MNGLLHSDPPGGAIAFDSTAQTRLLISLVTIMLLWLARSLVLRTVFHRTAEPRARYTWQKSSSYVAVALGAIFLALLWVETFRSFATFVGILAAGLAIALRDLVANFVGWLFIIWRRPFGMGDRVEISTFRGDVIDIRLFQFTLLEIGHWVDADQSTGRVVHVPNGMIMSAPLANYSKGFKYIWNEIPVLLTFESNWRVAKEILQRIVELHAEHLTDEARRQVVEASSRFMIFYPNLTPIVYTSVKESGVLLTMRYLCDPKQRRGSEHAIWEDVLREFDVRPDIEFAYPTWRVFARDRETPSPAP